MREYQNKTKRNVRKWLMWFQDIFDWIFFLSSDDLIWFDFFSNKIDQFWKGHVTLARHSFDVIEMLMFAKMEPHHYHL